MPRRLLLAVLLLAIPSVTHAQSLGEIAEKEKAKKKDPKAKTYTEEDLKKHSPDAGKPSPPPTPGALPPDRRARPKPTYTPRPSDEPEGAQSEPGPGEAAPVAPTPTEEAGWRARGQKLRQAVAAAEKKVTDLESQLRAANLDQMPSAEDLMDPNRLQNLEKRKAQLREEIEKAKADVPAARKALEDFVEGARLKGIPLGWLED